MSTPISCFSCNFFRGRRVIAALCSIYSSRALNHFTDSAQLPMNTASEMAVVASGDSVAGAPDSLDRFTSSTQTPATTISMTIYTTRPLVAPSL